MTAEAVLLEPYEAPREDHYVVLRGAAWADYQRLQQVRGDQSAPRITYVEGVLQIMSPSRTHESIKSYIGRSVEEYCLEAGLEFDPYGSWTIEDEALARGVEPDECYVFGEVEAPTRPDLAIEVVWTSGGIDKLEAHRGLGVHEVWFWRRGAITIHVLRNGTYETSERSEVLPGIDPVELASFLDRPTASKAIRDYRAALRARAAEP
ncbi:Uma2 family endonuclease [Paraliomyxa miuraensis]|uniref:Uma2 family endonuclease n=1 Tax=Paraliomyxa miuraensis TaxID=376150 RepID=UPI00225A6BD1|nr:Uma2 family endonuclease [Paraliomyxa miuraensis]MCX4245804.1 Uma2 family endonuclease [Paraliomyxa miuraensis]